PSFFLHRVRELLDLGDQPVDMSYYGPQALFCCIPLLSVFPYVLSLPHPLPMICS
ncbi:unnamed protein product, partial [Pylaiella littoralis]